MAKKRIVITGMGIVSCFGTDVEQFYQNLLAGQSGIDRITKFPCEEYSTQIAGAVKDFEPGDYIEKKQARRIDDSIAYTLVAGKKALESAQLTDSAFDQLNKERCGIVIGSGMGGMGVFSDNVQTLLEKGPKRVSPFLIPYILTNMCGALLGIEIGFMGPNYSVSTACATSNNAIISAVQHLRNGEADLMLAGGTEAALIPVGLAGFSACRAMSQRNEEPTKASRPWDQGRDGFVMGEGAGVLVFETLEHAQARGATILAEYFGGGLSCDAYHMTDPREDGAGVVLCLKNALKDAGIEAEEINYINAHATSTPVGDIAEIKALKQIFKTPQSVKMNATKSMIGHLLGAAGGVEAIATVMQIRNKKIHGTLNLENPEPDLAFDVPLQAEDFVITKALSNSFGFGGHNASIILGSFKP
jgi:3-oxoacyl-[acyl-carrier-protein] synthase II